MGTTEKNQSIMETLPRAWNMILQDPDSLLVDLLEETVEKICGIKPGTEETKEFIHQRHTAWNSHEGFKETHSTDSVMPKPSKVPTSYPEPVISPKPNTDGPFLILAGNQYQYKKAKDILTVVANWLIDKGHLKPQECPFSVVKSKTRYLVSQTPTHPNGKAFFSPFKLRNGLFIETHASKDNLIIQATKLIARYGYPDDSLKVM